MPDDRSGRRSAVQQEQEMQDHEREARERAGDGLAGVPREEGRTALGTRPDDPLPPPAAPLM